MKREMEGRMGKGRNEEWKATWKETWEEEMEKRKNGRKVEWE